MKYFAKRLLQNVEINFQNLADVVIPQEYGMTRPEKLTIAQVGRNK